MNKEVVFYSNTKDDTHCFQAALRMAMKYFWPDKEYSWEELDAITAKGKGLWTWPMAGLLWLHEKGVEVFTIEDFDYEKFATQGEQYLVDEFGEEVARVQIEHSNMEQERALAKEFSENITVKRAIPQTDDIKNLLLQDYILICNVNARVLNGKDGYVGHFVVVKGFNEEQFFLHDPGLPPKENRTVDFGQFEKAWAYPNAKAKNIMVLKQT